jgi:hypothetical protein
MLKLCSSDTSFRIDRTADRPAVLSAVKLSSEQTQTQKPCSEQQSNKSFNGAEAKILLQ